MVDMERVLGEIKRTAYVGVGTFGSTYVGNFLDEHMPGGDPAVAASQALAGAGAAVAVDEYIGGPRSTRGLDFDSGEMMRYASYGVGGAGFAELGDVLNENALFEQEQETVEVRTRSNASQASSEQETEEEPEAQAFSVNV